MDLSTDFEQLSLADLKAKSPADLLQLAEELEIENASSMRKGDMMFAILKDMAEEGVEISGDGVLEVLQDGFGFLRSPEANYLAGPDDIYVSPEPDPEVRRSAPATPSRASSGRRRRASATSGWSRSARSTSRIRRRPGTRFTSTT